VAPEQFRCETWDKSPIRVQPKRLTSLEGNSLAAAPRSTVVGSGTTPGSAPCHHKLLLQHLPLGLSEVRLLRDLFFIWVCAYKVVSSAS